MAVRRINFTLKKRSKVCTYRDVIDCLDRNDLRDAIGAFEAKQSTYVALDIELTRQFIEWGTKVKNACRSFKWGKIGFVINLVRLSIGAVPSGFAVYSAMKDLPNLMDAEPEFSFSLCHDYTFTETKRLFVDCSRYSLVGSAFHFSGRVPWPIHFRF